MIAGETAMCKINFVSEFRAFMRYAMQNGLSTRERNLWIALFYLANDRAKYNEQTRDFDWPDDFFLVANSELNLHSTLDKHGIETVRNSLKQRGLIDFKKGERNKRNPSYKINYLSVGDGNIPNIAPKEYPKHDPNKIPNHVPRIMHSMPPFLLNKILSNNIPFYDDFKKDLNIIDNHWMHSERARGAVTQRLIDYIEEKCPDTFMFPNTFELISRALLILAPYTVYLLAESAEWNYHFAALIDEPPEWAKEHGRICREVAREYE